MSYENLLVETHGKVALIRLNRPQALNALNTALMRELKTALDGFDADDKIGCVVITGSDKAFAAGADIKEMANKTFGDAFLGNFAADWHPAAEFRKPVIAAVAGFALGGGCELALQCDLIIAADNAKFGQPEIKLGIIPGIAGTQRLDARRRQGQGDGPYFNRPHDGCSRSRAIRRGRPRRPAGEPRRGGSENRRNHCINVAAVGAGG